jgi:sugar lactone lactonase YvrE
MRVLLVVLSLLAVGSVVDAQRFVISTAAGVPPFPTTPVDAFTASVGQAKGIATDADGNVYLAIFNPALLGRNEEYVLRLDKDAQLTRIAGGPRQGFSGDGGPAINALFNGLGGVVVDSSGNLYITDGFNSRVRKVSPSGIITTVAGNGTRGYSGDGGPATSASLSYPAALAVDSAGNLYFADGSAPFSGFQTTRIRKVSFDGIISTIAGTAVAGYSGDGGPATSAQVGLVDGLALDRGGNLYFTDTEWTPVVGTNSEVAHPRVRKISGGIITTVTGNGTDGHSGDGGQANNAQISLHATLAVDSAGSLYIADGDRVRIVSADGIITTLAGTGIDAQIETLTGLAMDSSGNLYLAVFPVDYIGLCPCVDGLAGSETDGGLGRIRKVSAAGIISTVAGNGRGNPGSVWPSGPATQTALFNPVGVAVDNSGAFYVGDISLLRVSPEGSLTTVAKGWPAASILGPAGMATDGAGICTSPSTWAPALA